MSCVDWSDRCFHGLIPTKTRFEFCAANVHNILAMRSIQILKDFAKYKETTKILPRKLSSAQTDTDTHTHEKKKHKNHWA